MPIKKEPKPKSFFTFLLKWLFVFFIFFIGTFFTGCYFFLIELDKELPEITQLENLPFQIPLDIYSQDGLLIGEYGEKKRIPLAIEKIPSLQIKAFLAAEDDRFYLHNGVDMKGLFRALTSLLTTGKKKQGGSTITMQVARNFLLSGEKTYLRKLKEILLALKIEKHYSKQQILELYLNKIYLGQNAYGLAAAAQTYYGKTIDQLELYQQAMLAGLPKAPSQFNPISDPERALQRRNYVLKRMLNLKLIDLNLYNLAVTQADNAFIEPVDIELNAPYVAEMARQEMLAKYGEEAYTLGLKVYTTIASNLQLTADYALQQTLHQYDERHGFRGLSDKNLYANLPNKLADIYKATIIGFNETGVTAKLFDGSEIQIPRENIAWAKINKQSNQNAVFLHMNDWIWVRQLNDQSWSLSQIPAAEAAFVAMNPFNGAILALSGGFDFKLSKYNRAVQSKRQPGSGFKPIIYTTALENGFTPASIINDSPIVIEDPSQVNDWHPENYNHRFLGPIPLRVALRESINLVSVRLLQKIGISQTIETALRFGFDKEQLPNTMSLALGSGSAAPLKMAQVYAVFANGGYAIKPYLIERIENQSGKVIFQSQPALVCEDCTEETIPKSESAPRVISAKVNFLMNSLLRDVIDKGTATLAKQIGRSDLAGKTGTTNDMRDAWFNGYAGDIVATAWLGFDNSIPLGNGETGGKTALPMWIEFMKTALQNKAEKPLIAPEGIVQAYINPNDGLLINQNNKKGIWEYFTKETVPTGYSNPKAPSNEEQNSTENNLF